MLTSERSVAVSGPESSFPTMRWGAIFGGWLVATGIASMLYVAGLAMGFSAFEPNNPDAVAKGIGMGAAAWMVITWTVSLLLGGMFASWFDGRSDQTMGALHGVTVWGLSITVTGLLLALGLGQALHGAAAVADGRVPQARIAQGAAQSNAVQGAGDAAAPSASPSAQPGGRASGTSDPAREEAAKRYAATAMWMAFLSTLFALIASGMGGWLGAGHIHRVHHLRRYEVRSTAPA